VTSPKQPRLSFPSRASSSRKSRNRVVASDAGGRTATAACRGKPGSAAFGGRVDSDFGECGSTINGKRVLSGAKEPKGPRSRLRVLSLIDAERWACYIHDGSEVRASPHETQDRCETCPT
jgi:hypothetical protein